MQVQVWDRFIRGFHWSMVFIVLVDGLIIDGGDIHRFLGYVLAGLLVARLIWGVIGTPFARFAEFAPGRREVRAHLQALRSGKPYHSLGHNPLGSLMIFSLLGLLVAVSVTGWMMGLDAYWGEEWLEELHEGIANLVLMLAAVHIFAVLASDLFWGEGLLQSMLTGRKNTLPSNKVGNQVGNQSSKEQPKPES